MLDSYTSTGAKFFAHHEVMEKLHNGRGQPIVTHVMLTDVCNHKCAFCSVQARAGDSLPFDDVLSYLDTLLRYGLKAVILSGGGNPILYKCKVTGKNFNDMVDEIHYRGLEIGLITNGMPLREFQVPKTREYTGVPWPCEADGCTGIGTYLWRGTGRDAIYCDKHAPTTIRESWGTVRPETLDKLTWIRISMSGLDHSEREVYVPDIDPSKTTLGFSYVAHDIYDEPMDKHHGKVSTLHDLHDHNDRKPTRWFEERIPELTAAVAYYVEIYHPRYVRLLPNCLEPSLIPLRCEQLQLMANTINPSVVFVQRKPPKAPHACYLGYIHPVLNCDGYVYPCDSCVLNEAAGHQFSNPWRVCHWSEIANLYDAPVRSLIADPKKLCPGCVFTGSNELLRSVVEGGPIEHVNFV